MLRRAYGPAQIQFECLSYIKEFGATPAQWTAGACTDPAQLLRRVFGVDRDHGIWLAKPALTPRAARAVVDCLHRRFGVQRLDLEPDGHVVFLVRSVRPAGEMRSAAG